MMFALCFGTRQLSSTRAAPVCLMHCNVISSSPFDACRIDINSNGGVSVATLASGSPTIVSIEAVFSRSATGDASAEGV